MGPLQAGERGLEPGDGGKAKPTLDWDWVSSSPSPGSANRVLHPSGIAAPGKRKHRHKINPLGRD